MADDDRVGEGAVQSVLDGRGEAGKVHSLCDVEYPDRFAARPHMARKTFSRRKGPAATDRLELFHRHVGPVPAFRAEERRALFVEGPQDAHVPADVFAHRPQDAASPVVHTSLLRSGFA